jgi:hypothetical protein
MRLENRKGESVIARPDPTCINCKARFCSTDPIARVTIGNHCRNGGYELPEKGQGAGYVLSWDVAFPLHYVRVSRGLKQIIEKRKGKVWLQGPLGTLLSTATG